MVINPFNTKNIYENTPLKKLDDKTQGTNIKKDVKSDIFNIQKFIVANYMEYLQNDLRNELIYKIKDYLLTNYNLVDVQKQDEIINILINKMFGYGILQKYIDTHEVTDIRVVNFDRVYIKKKGNWLKTNDSFESVNEFEEYVRYCIIKNNAILNFDVPMVIVSDKKYNLRIEAAISPVNPISASLTIRIHRHNKNITLESLFLIEDMLDGDAYKIIIDAINKSKNIILSGKGGSGKTTLLRGIIDKIPEEKSIMINEETMELYIENKNVIQREVCENRDDKKIINLEKLMKHGLVTSNDVLVVGELKGMETTVFLDAISTGHMGIATVHSNSAINTIDRLITLFKRDIKAQQYGEKFVEELLSSSIDLIIFLKDYEVTEIISIKYNKSEKKVLFTTKYNRYEHDD